MVSDFENALQQAMAITFEKVDIKGCWFHFNQSIIRKLFEQGFRNLYNNFDFKLWVRKFSALALIPPSKLNEAWDLLLDSVPVPMDENLLKFISYFVNTWIIGKPSIYCKPTIWNHHQSKYFRTNNHLEGFHSKLNKELKSHQSIYRVIAHFQRTDTLSSNIYEKTNQEPIPELTGKKKDKTKEKN